MGSVKCELGSVNWEDVGGGGVKSLSPTHQPVVQENGTPDTDTDADQGQDYTMGKAPYGQHLRSTWERYADELIRSHYTEWRGHKPYIQRLEDTELIHLVEWCVSLADDTAGQIKNYPAVIKSNVRQRASPLNLTRIRHREMSNWLTKLSAREGT